ncbi:NAD(P)-dependent oxidoreductase [Clostridium botulinum]|uniref:NAD(P)-dependent oxidoreductase n=1 Tax=Clostridium botulinum TaxID=1491 RepID=UPI0004D6192E|nr:NAD(P)-dependent oxidoreductase [Clostridium botulinum]KEI05447.1 dihydropyrimidine dehydrogenase [Clostridium botulinum C/D str. BKT75002]KEI09398.1 dihydropyrimidine dehydrogenase [Clostridium botulinum C/D str. BKT2873]MCD3349418.1 NAD(P)-dependent oxidoreductase [Clostridium botulinum D/C]MCD3358591.1 NAD(P)-dependent oxidoreductase [Clostridium botulinum D/C]MCD3363727.1 NAD(P)-dependent oxidoreductase [Clostridium botulinum D/C]
MNNVKECFNLNEETFTPLMAIEEAARCLLCYDAPCSKACPAETNPGKFIRSLRFRNLKGAVETIRENNALGGVCSRVCPTSKYCEGACSRCGIDKPIQIGKLQTYLTDYESNIKMEVLEPIECDKEKVAVIGSGPSGLVAAAELVKKGYNVTIFEAKDKFGGWLTYGIPSNRLPQIVVNNEIEYIKNLGVEFKNNCKIGKDITVDELKNQGFKAFLLAIGMQNAKIPNIKGINFKGVLKGTEFLSQVKTNKGEVELGKKVIVIGGGDVAIDCAITSRLLGAEDVKIVYRRTLEKMPADKEELTYTQKHNIPVFTGFKPYEIIGKDGKVTRFKCEGMFDDSQLELPADTIIFAIGQEVEDIKTVANVEVSESGIIKNLNYETSIEGVFASGDIVDGDKTVVYAVKEGKEAAKAIENYLEKEGAR